MDRAICLLYCTEVGLGYTTVGSFIFGVIKTQKTAIDRDCGLEVR